ncbi:MAG: Asp-tRNA(Asn)/Glu-tRNA(Gln) amidotransferase subunit GatB, partial [Oscillospiraceae bacterium]|jgi:aspartyl-tRNA(Asn)/glutamyl-tRNA(Gln) amidotransferase subunit B|nr:Asp-tRNA(Asn)/Glu-tRNA(Gln) amidotransferase subunit GatB [Oscillospiraceae bacterium]
MKYYPTIGLEIHSELLTESKIFCGCSAAFGGEPNSRCCPVCSGLPGTLPVLNRQAVEFIIRAGFATGCEISRFTKWDRKNYFYPDLPKAYQISQMPRPVCLSGALEVNGGKYRINRIHLEEDAGKLVHAAGDTLADYNRCGIPLMELVTEPDFHTTEEVKAFVERLRLIYMYIGVCDGKMEQGSLRCDVNISIAPEGCSELGTRAEIKNLNSTRSITRAIEYEIIRQTELLESGGRVVQETRRFDDNSGETLSMRSKEDAHDYRYFPDPDIPPVLFTEDELSAIEATLPELPRERLARYMGDYKLSPVDAENIVNNPLLAFYFDAAVSAYPTNPKGIGSALLTDFTRRVTDFENLPITAPDFAELIQWVDEGKIARLNYKDVLREIFDDGASKDFRIIAEQNGYIIKQDNALVEKTISEVLSANPTALTQYRSGDNKVFGFLMGQCSAKLKGVATPQIIKPELERQLQG